MFKAFIFLKRKDGMSVAEFRDYYETTHARLGEMLVPKLRRYVRHYLDPFGEDTADDLPYDVVTEICFDNRGDFEAAMAAISSPDNARVIGEDEERLFDRSLIKFMTVVDKESQLGTASPA